MNQQLSKMEKLEIFQRLRNANAYTEAKKLLDTTRHRISEELGGKSQDKKAAVDASWREVWNIYKPVVEKLEQQIAEQDAERADRRLRMGEDAPVQLAGMPERTTDEILDPDYNEPDKGKQLRDGLLWAAMEFDRVISETDDGPVAHLEDASKPPPNAFAVGVMRTYALSPMEKRRDLVARALAFAAKSHDEKPESGGEEEAGFLSEIE